MIAPCTTGSVSPLHDPPESHSPPLLLQDASICCLSNNEGNVVQELKAMVKSKHNRVGKVVPEMRRRVTTIENHLFAAHVFLDPRCPSLDGSSICFHSIKFRIDVITFFVVVFPAASGVIFMNINVTNKVAESIW